MDAWLPTNTSEQTHQVNAELYRISNSASPTPMPAWATPSPEPLDTLQPWTPAPGPEAVSSPPSGYVEQIEFEYTTEMEDEDDSPPTTTPPPQTQPKLGQGLSYMPTTPQRTPQSTSLSAVNTPLTVPARNMGILPRRALLIRPHRATVQVCQILC